MNANEENRIKLTDIMQVISIAVGNITVIFIVSSILYEYFYFSMLDWDMLCLLSATDFLKLLIYWLPTTILLASFGWFVNYTDATARFRAVERHGDAGLAAWRSPDKWMQRLQYVLLFAGLISVPFISFRNFSFMQVPAYLLIGYVVSRLIATKFLPLTVRPQDALFFYMSIMLLMVTAVFGGANAAVRDIDKQSPIHLVETSAGQFRVILMRYVDKGVIYHFENDNRITFTPWDKINSIKSEPIVVSDRKIHQWVYDLLFGNVEKAKIGP